MTRLLKSHDCSHDFFSNRVMIAVMTRKMIAIILTRMMIASQCEPEKIASAIGSSAHYDSGSSLSQLTAIILLVNFYLEGVTKGTNS